MAISSSGVGAGLDVNSIVQQLTKVESKPLTVLSGKESSYKSKLSAYGSLSSALSAFQSAVAGLNNLSRFQQLSATTADSAIVTAAAGSSAAPGRYEIDVIQRAQAQSLSTAGQQTTSGAIGGGALTTLTFQFGTISGGTLTGGVYDAANFAQDARQSSGTVTIDASNNSLQGIRDAINKAAIGVTATIVSDGSASPNRLVLTSTQTGAASSMKIAVDGDAALQELLAYDPSGAQKLTQNTVGQDALLKVNGIDIKSASNTLSGTIGGLTLTLGKIGSTSISVARDTASIESGVNAFIKSYNELHGMLKYQTGYNAETRTGGPLVGDATARTIQNELRRMFASQPEGLNGGLGNLSQIGIAFQKDGTLALDSAKLKSAIAANPGGVGKLFATAGTSTDSLVSFVSSTAATKAGGNTLFITALATKGQITGSAQANTSIEAGVNDALTLTIDGVSARLKLSAGTYTADSLSKHLQSMINGVPAFSSVGISVTAAEANGMLSVTSNRFGSASKVAISGDGAVDLLGVNATSSGGIDVAGTINGIAALGAGQFLTGAAGTSAEGLKVQIAGGAVGDRGSISFSKGYATQLHALVGTFLGAGGLISGRTDGINRSIKDIGAQRDTINNRLANIEARYRKQFTALDAMLAGMASTGSYLTQQLASLSNLNNR